VLAAVAGTGVILGAVYMLYAVKRMFFGTIRREELKHLADLNGREIAVLAPLVAMIFIMGVAPTPFFARMQPAAKEFIKYSAAVKPALEAKPVAEK